MFKVEPYAARTLSWWYTRRDQIDMDPPYQRRGGIWSQRDQAYLIDSIINEYDVPKIYMADFSFGDSYLNAKRKPYAVIDGKQRLEAIFSFFDGRLKLEKNFEYGADSTLNLTGLTYQDLKIRYPQVAEGFDNFNLSVMKVITDDESKINELFVRLNRSKPLTGAELRNAMAGIVPEIIRDISVHSFFERCVRFSIDRGGDWNAAGKLLLTEFRGCLVDTKRTHLNKFVEEGQRSEAQPQVFARAGERVVSVLDKMAVIFAEKDSLLASQGSLVVYYWLVRSIQEAQTRPVREFLVRFQDEAQRVRRVVRASPGGQASAQEFDAELIAYNTYTQSANDQGSLEARYAILMRRFAQFEETARQTIQMSGR